MLHRGAPELLALAVAAVQQLPQLALLGAAGALRGCGRAWRALLWRDQLRCRLAAARQRRRDLCYAALLPRRGAGLP